MPSTMNVNRAIPSLWFFRIPVILAAVTSFLAAGPVSSQGAPWPSFQVGIVSQGTRETSESGGTIALAVPILLHRPLFFVAGVDLVRTHIGDATAICTIVIEEPRHCLDRPDRETVLYPSTVLSVRPFLTGRFQLALEGGLSVGQSLGPETLGERHRFLAPQFGLGFHLATKVGTWTFTTRWRRLDRWSPHMEAGSHLALLLGWRPGRSK
jgi:hypothetical protein